MVRRFSNLGIKENSLTYEMIYQRPTANTILNGKILEAIFMTEVRKRFLFLPLLFNIIHYGIGGLS